MQNECVFLHGWGMNKNVWQLLIPELESEISMPIKTFDLPGFGNELACPEPYNLANVANQVASKLADNSTLVGWSLGGLISLYIAKHYPEKVTKVILVASSPYFTEQESWPGIKPDVLKAFMSQLSANTNKTIDRFLAIQAMGSDTAKQDIKQLKQFIKSAPEPQEVALTTGLDFLLNEDLRQLFSELTIPVNGIFGSLDALVPIKAVDKIQALNAQFKAKIIPKASHAPFISHKAEFIKAIKETL